MHSSLKCLWKVVGPFTGVIAVKSNRHHLYRRCSKESVRWFSLGKVSPARPKGEARLFTSFFCDLLGTSAYFTTKKLEYYPDVISKPLDSIKETLKTLEELGVQRLDVANNLQILALSRNAVQHRYMGLQELGFTTIEAPEILWYEHIMSSHCNALKAQGILPEEVEPFQHLVRLLNDPVVLKIAILAHFSNPETMPLQHLKEKIIEKIVVFYLGLEEKVVQKMIKASRELARSNVGSVKKVLEIYRNEFSLPSEMFRRHPNILGVLPEDITALLEVGETYQVDIRGIISRLPSVVRIAPQSIGSIFRSLIDYGICVQHVSEVPKLLLSTPENVSTALATLSTWPEFHILKARSSFLSVILGYKRASLHMEYLKKAGFERCNIRLLLSSDEVFQKHLCRGEETETCKEIAAYLAERLECSELETFNSLRYHPSFPKTSVINVKATLAYLFKTGFSREQIRRGLPLVLYPKSKVLKNWRLLPQLEISQPFSQWIGDPNLLHLLLYVMEKEEYIFLKPTNIPTLLPVINSAISMPVI